MAIELLLDYLSGQIALVNAFGGSVTPPTGGTALFADSTGVLFADSTPMDWNT